MLPLEGIMVIALEQAVAAPFATRQLAEALGRWREVDSPGGPLRALLPPVTVPSREALMGPVPALGQHTAAVLAELGMRPAGVGGGTGSQDP